MARRGFNALRAALGAVTGVAEGLQQREVLKAQRQKEAEEMALRQFATLNAAGFRPTLARTTADPAAREAFALDTPTLPSPTPQAAQSAMGRALQAGMGVSSKPTGALDSPIRMALDTSKTRQFERGAAMQKANPEMQINLPGVGRVGFDRPLTDDEKLDAELKKYEAQQDLLQKREDVKNDRTNRGIFTLLQKEGQFPKGTTYEEAKALGNLEPYLKDYLAGQSQTAAFQRALTMAGAQAARGSYIQMIDPQTGQPVFGFAPSGGPSAGGPISTGISPVPNPSTTRIPVTEKKGMNELESTVKELDNAIKAVEENPDAFGLQTMLPNVVLSRGSGVKPRAVVTGAITKLRRTDFGTAQTESEKKSGVAIYPDKGEAAPSTKEKLTALKEKALLELNTKREFYGLPPYGAGSQPPKANAAAPAGNQQSLEAQFPTKRGEINEARRNGYTDAQIRAFLSGGR
jgi:hypothetical protein